MATSLMGLTLCLHVQYNLMYIIGAKFEQHPSNIFGDILNFVIYYSHVYSLWCHKFSTKTWVSRKQEKKFQNRIHHSSSFLKVFKDGAY